MKNRIFFFTGLELVTAWLLQGCVSKQKETQPPPAPISLGSWVKMDPIPAGCFIHTGVAVNRTIYLLGGGGGPYVWYAPVGSDGKPGKWQRSTIPEGIAFNYSKAVARDNRIYLVGGHAKDATNNGSVAYVELKADGTPGVWKKTTALPNKMACGGAATSGSYLYYVGGWYYRRAYCAPVNADGTVGEWKEIKHLISPRGGYDLFAVNGWLYVVAGNSGHTSDTTKDTVYRGKILADGSIDKWLPDNPIPVPASSYGGALVGDVLVVAGGTNPEGRTAETWAARVGKDGAVGDWVKLPPLPRVLDNFASVYVDGWLYVTGGFFTQTNGVLGVSNEVYGAPVQIH